MPIFEYSCRACAHQFELLVLKSTVVACPECKSADLEKLLSLPAVKSDTTHALAMKAAKKRDARPDQRINTQAEYEANHDNE